MNPALFPCLLSAAVAFGPPVQDPPQTRTVVYSLKPLLVDQDNGITWGTLLPPNWHTNRSPSVSHRSESSPIHQGALQQVIYDLLREELQASNGSLVLDGVDGLAVRGPQALHAQVQQLLGGLERVLDHRAELRVRVYRGAPEAFGALPATATAPVAALVQLAEGAGATLVDDVRLELRVGSTGQVDLRRFVPQLMDYDVEVASGAVSMDPQVSGRFIGTRVAGRYVPQGAGGALSLLVERTELLGELRTVPLEMKAQVAGPPEADIGTQFRSFEVTLEQQDVATTALALDLELQPGQAGFVHTVYDLGAAQGAELTLFEVQSAPLRPVEVLEVGARRLVLVDRDFLARPVSFVLREDGDEEGLLAVGTRRANRLLLQIAARSNSILDRDLLPTGRGAWEPLGSWLATWTATAAEAEPLRRRVEELARPESPALRLLARAQQGGRNELVRADLPVRVGGQAFALVVTSSPRIADYDVEVASSAGVSDPLVVDTEQGLVLGVVPLARGEGLSVGVRAEVQVSAGELRQVAAPTWHGGLLQLQDLDALRADQTLTLGSEPVWVGSRPGLSISLERR
jgi:hypothetical protein